MLTAVVLHPPRFGAHGRLGRRPGGAGRARGDRGRPDRGGRRRGRRDGRRRAARAARPDRGVGRHATPSGAAPPSCWPSTSGCWSRASRPWSPGTTATSSRCSPTRRRSSTRSYALPYLAHAAMEPNNAACRMREDGVLDVWAGTESPEYTRMSASAAAGIDKEQVEVHVTFAGGSFGLHSERRARPDGRGRADRSGARLEASDQGPVAARGGIQERPLPRDGRAPRAGRAPTRTVG